MIRITVDMNFKEDVVEVIVKKAVEQMKQLALEVAESVHGTALEFVPRRTGRLASTIQLVQTLEGVEVLVTAPYARKVERDVGFFSRAVRETEEKIPTWLRSIEIGP